MCRMVLCTKGTYYIGVLIILLSHKNLLFCIYCKRVQNGDAISFPERELGQRNLGLLVALGDKLPCFPQSRAELSGLEQDILALKMDSVKYELK
jgi:hypothetical protein